MGNTFGQLFRVTTWGESHGAATGAVIDGCPPCLPLGEADIQPDLDRRRPGQSLLTSQRKESDTVRILSGVFEGMTLGTPIALEIQNEDMRPGDYREMQEKYRPSHADYTYDAKYGVRDWRGGGRTSARETAARVAAGAVARKLLHVRWGVEVVAWVARVGRIAAECDVERVTLDDVERTPIRCPDPAVAERMIAAVEAARKDGNSLGGLVTCALRGCPPGWGEPVFDRLEADLAKAMLSLPASKGFDIGSGFGGGWTIARPRAMTSATTPSIFSLDRRLDGFQLSAASFSSITFVAIHRMTGWPPWRSLPDRTKTSRCLVGAFIET